VTREVFREATKAKKAKTIVGKFESEVKFESGGGQTKQLKSRRK
jgi:hypothetical protein